MRIGLIAQKVGMTRIFNDAGDHVPVTVLKVDSCQVTAIKSHAKEGYDAVQLGVGAIKPKNVNKAQRSYFEKIDVPPKRRLAEFRVPPEAFLQLGDKISVDHFLPGQYVDVTGTSQGKGFAGVMKRKNYKGGRASHGASLSHRTPGSTGQRQDPGKVFKGKGMPGHMGHETVTVQNLKVDSVDLSEDLIFLRGAVPGALGDFVLLRDSIKKKQSDLSLPFPAALKQSDKTSKTSDVSDRRESGKISDIQESSEETVSVVASEATPQETAFKEPIHEAAPKENQNEKAE